jgi:hypothetical protein
MGDIVAGLLFWEYNNKETTLWEFMNELNTFEGACIPKDKKEKKEKKEKAPAAPKRNPKIAIDDCDLEKELPVINQSGSASKKAPVSESPVDEEEYEEEQ